MNNIVIMRYTTIAIYMIYNLLYIIFKTLSTSRVPASIIVLIASLCQNSRLIQYI